MSTPIPQRQRDVDAYYDLAAAIGPTSEAFANSASGPATWRTWFRPHDEDTHQPLLRDGWQPDGTFVHTHSIADWQTAHLHAGQRVIENRNKGNSKAYAAGYNRPERIASADALLTEIAVTRHFNVPLDHARLAWPRDAHNLNRTAGDLTALTPEGPMEIEVRSIAKITNMPRIKPKDNADRRLIVVASVLGPEGFQVRIHGIGVAADLHDAGGRPLNWGNRAWDPKTGDRAFPLSALSPCPCRTNTDYGHTQPADRLGPPACTHELCAGPGRCLTTNPGDPDWEEVLYQRTATARFWRLKSAA